MILLYIPLGNRQAEAGPLRPRREERLAHRRQYLGGNPGSAVDHFDRDQRFSIMDRRGTGDAQAPAAGHGIERIGHDLEQRLLQLHGVDLYLRQVRWQLELKLHTWFLELLLEGRKKSLDQMGNGFPQRMKWGGPGKAQKMADPPVQPVNLLDDGAEVFRGTRRVGMAKDQLGCSAQAGQRVPETVRNRRGHFTDRRQLFRLDQLDLGALQLGDLGFQLRIQPEQVASGLAQAFPHPVESACQLSDFVPGGNRHRMLQISCTNHRHSAGKLIQGARQAARNEPGAQQTAGNREHQGEEENTVLIRQDDLQAGVCTPDAGFPRLPVDLAVQLGKSGKQPSLELALGGPERSFVLARVIEPENAVCGGLDLRLDLLNPYRELLFVRTELGCPALLPVVHHLPGKLELLACVGIETAQITPDDFALIEHCRLELGICPSSGHARPQRLESTALQNVAADRARGHDGEGRHHDERKSEEEFALEGHISKLTGKLRLVSRYRLAAYHRSTAQRRRVSDALPRCWTASCRPW